MPVERKWQHALCRTPQTESARVMHRYSAEAVQPEIDKDKPREPSSDVSASETLVDWVNGFGATAINAVNACEQWMKLGNASTPP